MRLDLKIAWGSAAFVVVVVLWELHRYVSWFVNR